MLVVGIIHRFFFLLLNKRKFDVIIIEKELVTFMPFFLEKMLLKGTKFILDYDDNIDARYQIGWAKVFLSKKIIKMAHLANKITVGNHWYMDFYKEVESSKIHFLPTVIDKDLYSGEISVGLKNKVLTIVWIGSISTVKYLESIDEVFVKLQSHYNVRLKVIGAKIKLNCAADFLEWDSSTEIKELKQSHIGIMPLENTQWEKGKCGFKLIQYMACGLPVVASYSVANSEIIESNCGFIARSSDEWYNYLSELLQSELLRTELGENGRTRIYEKYSYQTWAPVFNQLLNSVNS